MSTRNPAYLAVARVRGGDGVGALGTCGGAVARVVVRVSGGDDGKDTRVVGRVHGVVEGSGDAATEGHPTNGGEHKSIYATRGPFLDTSGEGRQRS